MKRKALPTILIKIHRIKFINSIHKQHQYIPIFVLTYYTTPPLPKIKENIKTQLSQVYEVLTKTLDRM